MRAVFIIGYGDLDRLQVRDAAAPEPAADQVLVRVVASSVNPLDWKLRKGMLRWVWPLKFPFTPGFDASGVVQGVGVSVRRWKAGDAVVAGLTAGGGQAEFVAVDQSLCVAKPESVTHREGAAVPSAAISALQALRNIAKVSGGQHVLVNGASGGVGTFAVQIAKALQCRVTAVCSTYNVPLVRSLGADDVIDYTQRDVLQTGPYDVFFDVVANRTFRDCLPVLSSKGIYITTEPGPAVLAWKLLSMAGRLAGFGKRCGILLVKPNGEDLRFIVDLLASAKVRSIVGQTFPLAEIRDANALSESGHARGKIVIDIGGEGQADAE